MFNTQQATGEIHYYRGVAMAIGMNSFNGIRHKGNVDPTQPKVIALRLILPEVSKWPLGDPCPTVLLGTPTGHGTKWCWHPKGVGAFVQLHLCFSPPNRAVQRLWSVWAVHHYFCLPTCLPGPLRRCRHLRVTPNGSGLRNQKPEGMISKRVLRRQRKARKLMNQQKGDTLGKEL